MKWGHERIASTENICTIKSENSDFDVSLIFWSPGYSVASISYLLGPRLLLLSARRELNAAPDR